MTRRFGSQCQRIFGRLQRGRTANSELSEISLKYTGRISELRQRGHDIRVVQQDRVTGLTFYALFVGGLEAGR